MKLANATVFITGANRGLGLAFAREALERGATKVYAGARDPSSVKLAGVVPVKLDVTDPAQVAAAAKLASDATIVINNAGIAQFGGFLAEGSIEAARKHMETNYFGTLLVSQAFAPVLAKNGGGALLNMLSVASFTTGPMLATYAASKSAAWSLTNALRHELRAQKTQVLGIHAAFIDTDMTQGIDAPKSSPQSIARAAFDSLEAGDSQSLTDERSKLVFNGLSANPPVFLAPIA